MSDTLTGITLLDGLGVPKTQAGLLTAGGSIVPEMALRTNSAAVSASNPLPGVPILNGATLSVANPMPGQIVVGGAGISTGNPLPSQAVVPPMAYAGAGSATVATTSGLLISAGSYTRVLTIQTLPGSTGNVFLRCDGSPAAVNSGQCVFAGGGSFSFGTPASPMPIGNITAITDAGAPQTVMLSGG
jgi:hypothetical protein